MSWIDAAGDEYRPEMFDEATCRAWVLNRLHPGGASCPACSFDVQDARRLERFWQNERISCESCGKKFSATSATVLSGMHLSFRELFYLLQQSAAGVNAQEISRKMNVDGNTVRLWISRLRNE